MKCFADAGLNGAKGCSVLKKKQCDDCPFYKTVEQKRIDDMKTFERLNSLDNVTKMYISEKYNLRLY